MAIPLKRAALLDAFDPPGVIRDMGELGVATILGEFGMDANTLKACGCAAAAAAAAALVEVTLAATLADGVPLGAAAAGLGDVANLGEVAVAGYALGEADGATTLGELALAAAATTASFAAAAFATAASATAALASATFTADAAATASASTADVFAVLAAAAAAIVSFCRSA